MVVFFMFLLEVTIYSPLCITVFFWTNFGNLHGRTYRGMDMSVGAWYHDISPRQLVNKYVPFYHLN